MENQTTQILGASRAYIVHLNPDSKGHKDRYAIYLDCNRGLEVLWPHDTHENKPVLLPYQKYHKRPTNGSDRYPAYHFVLNGGNYCKFHTLACDVLRAINPTIEVLKLTNGWSPTTVSK